MSNYKNSHLTSLLKQFDLTENDSTVYLFLLQRIEPIGSSKMATILGIHRQYVYNTVQKLLDLGLIEKITLGHLSKYRALPPSQLTKTVENKLALAERTVGDLNKISVVGTGQEVRLYQGEKEIQLFEIAFSKLAKENSEQLVIGGTGKAFSELMGERYEEMRTIMNGKNITTRYLTHEYDKETKRFFAGERGRIKIRELRQLPEGLLDMVIRHDMVAFYSFVTPPSVYAIRSQKLAESYRSFFEMLWRMGVDL